ncbi:MAG TPA: S53 family peptidase, partial [Acidimicrobiales bacterium]|nr:S53 family peptidase [Acidimicrobiales bacterium]
MATAVRLGHRASAARRRFVGGAVGLVTAAFGAVVPAASAAPVADAASNGSGTSMVAVTSAPRIPVGDVALGAVSLSTTISGALVLEPRDPSAVTKFIAAVTDRRSPEYHHYLAPGTYRTVFGPTEATIARVESVLRSEGLGVSGVSSNGLIVSFSGSAATVERAFGTGLERYRLPSGAPGMGTTAAARVPASIASSVVGVAGLDNLLQPHTTYEIPGKPPAGTPKAVPQKFSHPAGSPTPCADASQDATLSGGLTDDQILNSYGAFGLYSAGDFGQGQHIAVFEQQPFLPSDIEGFDTCYFGATEAALMSGTNGNLTGSRLSIVPVDGGELQPGPGSSDAEATLDIEDVSATAPESNIDVYETPNTTFGGLDAYAQIVQNDSDQLVTSSWFTGCEQGTALGAPGIPEEENIIFQQAAAQGQTILNAAGDTGDDTCNVFRSVPEPPGQNVLSLDDPGSQPYVVSVGGTTISNATQPPTEYTWNDGANWGGGGGGISEAWTMPSWQQGLILATSASRTNNAADVTNAENVETATASFSAPFATPTFCDGTLGVSGPCRETPDVSAQADEFTGAVTIYGLGLGFGFPDLWATIGGTSSATPLWAAMLALVNQSSSCSSVTVPFDEGGHTVNVQDAGFASPILYGIASNAAAYAASFNDITMGNNDVFGLDNGLVFPARAGYDMASGLGSPQLTTPTGGNGLAYYMCQFGAVLPPPTVTALAPTFGST